MVRIPLSVGVVGCGWWSTTAHLPAICGDPRTDLGAVSDVDPGKLHRAAARFGNVPRFEDWNQMLDDVTLDAVVVATPAARHFDVAKAVLERGISVLIEKPMVIDPADGRVLLQTAARTQSHVAVGYTFHHAAAVIALKELLDAGRLGSIEHVSCTFASIMRELLGGKPERYGDGGTGFDMAETPLPDTYSVAGRGGGQALSQMTHSVALALHLSDLAPASVCGRTANLELDVDVADAFSVSFANGATGSFDSVGTVPVGAPELLQCLIFGSDGYARLDLISGDGSVHVGGSEVLQLPRSADPYPVAAPLTNLIDVIRGEAPNRAPGALGQQVVQLLDAGLRSARSGETIMIDTESAA